jgi:polar amino acid transport system permease protein
MGLLVQVLPQLLEGVWVTILLTMASTGLTLAVALIGGIGSLSRYVPVRAVLRVYIEIMRGTSLLVQLFWIFFVLPFFGISLSPFIAGVICIGLNAGAYGSEIVRGAVKAVPRGQIEAATALNMTRRQALRRVIVPQAAMRMLPPFGNLIIEILKSTSLASLITLSDMTFKSHALIESYGNVTQMLTIVLALYFILAYPMMVSVRWLERRLTFFAPAG